MAFLDELKKTMSGVAAGAQKAAEVAKLQRQVNMKQDEFQDLFREIGQFYYDCHKRGMQPGEEMDSRCAKVDSLAAEIEGLKLKLDDIRQIRRCTGCGAVQNTDSKFCANCGAKLEERVAPAEEPEEAPAEETEEETSEDIVKSVFISWPGKEDASEETSEEAAEETGAEKNDAE